MQLRLLFFGSTRRCLPNIAAVCATVLWLALLSPRPSQAEGFPCGQRSTNTIGYGTVLFGCDVDSDDQTDAYTFAGASGDRVVIVAPRESSFGIACLELFNPLGSRVAGPTCNLVGSRVDSILASSGTYTLHVSDQNLDENISYSLTLERILPPSPTVRPVSPDQPLSDQIDVPGDLDLYAFSATAGQALVLQVSRTVGSGVPCAELFGPSGNRVAGPICNLLGNRIDYTVSTAGAHTILVSEQSHDGTVQYTVDLDCSGQCTPLSSDLTGCLAPRSLNVSLPQGAAPTPRSITVGNSALSNCSLGTVASFTASVTMFNGAGWLSVSPANGTLFPGTTNVLTATFNPAGLAPGTAYQGFIEIAISSLNRTIRVPVTLTVTSPRQRISLSWNSFAFQTVENTPAPSPQTLRIYSGVPGALNWRILPAEPATFPTWLSISPLQGTAGDLAGQGSPVTISVNPSGLSAEATTNRVYSALVAVTADGASNSPQYVSITFHVVRITASPVPLLNSYGMIFRATQNGAPPSPQTFQIANTGGGSIITNLIRSTQTGGGWLIISKNSSTLNTGVPPDTITVSVNPAGVPVGLYRGKISLSFIATNSAGGGVTRGPQELDVALIVTPPPAIPAQRTDTAANGCAPTRMEMLGATIGNGLNAPVSFPQVLLVQMVDDCGVAVTGATAVAVAEGQSIQLSEVGGGLYTGNWTPQTQAAATTISFTVFHPSFASVQQSFAVATVAPSGGTQLPVLFNGGIVEGAGFSQGRPLVPGGIVSIFGQQMAPPNSQFGATQIPLERSLGQTSVRIGNILAPLYFVSPGQINAQVPFEIAPGDTISIVVNAAGRLTTPALYQISPAQPGIFKATANAAVLDSESQLVTELNPARIGEIIQVYSSGLGFTSPQVPSGSGSPNFSDVAVPVNATVGGIPATVVYQGLAPGYVGLYQVNVVVPQGVTPGPAVSLVITQNGVPSNPDLPITLPITN